MNIPKYMTGDLVKLKDEFPEYMSHFSGKGCEAIVINHDDFLRPDGDGRPNEYGLYIRGHGYTAWYEEDNIEKLIDTRRMALIPEWKADIEKARCNREREIKEKRIEMFKDILAKVTEENPNAECLEIAETAIGMYHLERSKLY